MNSADQPTPSGRDGNEPPRADDEAVNDQAKTDQDSDDLVSDDQVIGRAFRWSLLAIVGIAVLCGLGWLLIELMQPPAATLSEEASADLRSLLADADQPPLPMLPFTDVTATAGIDFVHSNGAAGERLLPETMGGGVAWFDYDGDQRPDLLLVDSGPWPDQPAHDDWAGALRLYRNLGDGRFSDVSKAAGLHGVDSYGMGVAVADIDADGDQDLFLTAVGGNRLFRNDSGHFSEITAQAGVAGEPTRWSSSAGFFDYDRDGWLDLWVVNYIDWSRERDLQVDYRLDGIGRAYGPPTQFPGTQNYLYRNRGDGSFVDVSEQQGIHVFNEQTGVAVGKGLALLTEDMDGDGWVDVVVANDTVRNLVFRNLGEGRGFEEVGETWGLGYDRNGMATGAMGMDSARVGEDDSRAIAIGNFANEMSSYYVTQGTPTQFADEAMISGIGPASRTALSFGVVFFDADLDGRADFLQANGHVENDINRVQQSQRYAQPAQLFWNCGSACRSRFVDLPADHLGDLVRPMVGRGASVADFDGDGDLDVVLTQISGPPMLLRNDIASPSAWIEISLQTAGNNPDALGADVRLLADGHWQQRWVGRNRSYLSQTDLPLHFGLGSAKAIERMEIRWPDGAMQTVDDPAINQRHVIRQPTAANTNP